jgi:radical SAM superfamily enzyme YgiQ (UPF0313 family)
MGMRIEKIGCIQLGGEFPDFCHRLVMPDYGLPLIGTVLSEAGYRVTVYMEHVQPPRWERIRECDLVCFSSLNAGADKVYRLAARIRAELGIPVIIGGTHATYFPESCLEHADFVVRGEGDETILELVETLKRGGDVSKVAGIAYRAEGKVHRTAPRPGPERFDTAPDFSLIEGYPTMSWLDVLWERRKPLLTAQSSRGCPFHCTFCIVNTMFVTGYRKRDLESVIEDLRDKRRYGRELIFVDNDFAMLRPRTKELLRRMIEEDFGFDIIVFTRVENTRDTELLSLMRRAGISQIYQGYESVQPQTLDAYDKRQTISHITASIERIHSFGFRILGSFVLGADTDSLETVNRTVDFVLGQKLSNAYFFPIWGHFPEQINGYQTIVPWYRSIFRGWKYCDGNFVSHFPLQMPPSTLQRGLIDAHRAVYSSKEIARALLRRKPADAKEKLLHRYVWRDIENELFRHIAFLEELEDGLYDARGRLIEERLLARVERDPRWTFQAANRAIEGLGLSPLELPIPGERNITCPPPTAQSFSPEGHPSPFDA